MRVRSLQTFLTNQNLIHTGPLDELKGFRIGVDAVYWLRTLPNLKDPLADAIGGLPPSVFGVLDSNIQLLLKHHIGMIFVFQGMQPRSHMLFSSQLHQQMDDAWHLVSEGEYIAAQHRFAQATSRINSDFVHVVSHHLQSKNCETFQAPYFAASQLTYFAQESVVDAVLGPPALLLFGIPRVIIGINFQKKEFDWVDRDHLLKAWKISEDQLIDACLLAGTEYCLTFPYLNLSQFQGGGQHFQFGTAIDFIKQAPLVGYMQHFPSEEMRADHVDGYCICKCLIKYPLAMHLDGKVKPVIRRKAELLSEKEKEAENNHVSTDGSNGNQMNQHQNSNIETKSQTKKSDEKVGKFERKNPNNHEEAQENKVECATVVDYSMISNDENCSFIQVPDDFHKIVGLRLPNSIFFLMSRNILSRKLPSVLALGEWWDLSHPTVDSMEYRDLLTEIQEYRRRAVGLIALRLHPSFREKPIRFSRYSCVPPSYGVHNDNTTAKCLPDCRSGMPWYFTVDDLFGEMRRQNTEKVSFRFCLNWHANEANNGCRLLIMNKTKPDETPLEGPQIKLTHLRLAEAAVCFMLLENLGYFTQEGGVTVFGSALTSTISEFEEDVLFALELMKCGELIGEPLEAPPDRPFPPSMALLKHPENIPNQRPILLISRVCSLISMTLTNSDLWLAPVDFDLAAFHSIVRILKQTFRHLSEACLANLLLQDITATSVIPVSALDPRSGGFPSFMLPRNCMGIIMKHFLEFQTVKRLQERADSTTGPSIKKLKALESELHRFYPCCKDPLADLFKAFRFWNEIVRVIENLSQNIDVSVLKDDMDEANRFLLRRIAEVGIHLHETFRTEPFDKMRQDIAPLIAALPTESTTTAASGANHINSVLVSPKRDGVTASTEIAPSKPSDSSIATQ